MTNLGWQTLERRRLQSQLSMLYKINQNLAKINVPPNLLISPGIIRNDDLNKFVQIQCRTILLAYYFYPRTIIVWNSLPSNILLLPFSSFKQAVIALPLTAPIHLNRYSKQRCRYFTCTNFSPACCIYRRCLCTSTPMLAQQG